MVVQLKKGRDGPSSLACVRPDGTRTWRTVHPFFPVHDLTHYAVESVLGLRRAFFGLVASGWDIASFEEPGARGRLPVQALWAENIVGLFDLERGMRRRLSADEFGAALGECLARQGVRQFRPLTEDDLDRVRALRSDLQGRWIALAPGETLQVRFPADGAAAEPT